MAPDDLETTTRTTMQAMGVADVLGHSALFQAWSEPELAALAEGCAFARFTTGQDIVREGDPAAHMFVLVYGKVVVVARAEDEAGGEHVLATRSAPQYFGESALLEGGRRAATVRATEDVLLVEIPTEHLRKMHGIGPFVDIMRGIVVNMRESTEAARASLDTLRRETRMRSMMGHFTLLTIAGFALYTAALGNITAIKQTLGRSEFVTIPILLIMGLFLFAFMRETGARLSFFGVRSANVGRDALGGLLISSPLLLVVVGLKLAYLETLAPPGEPLFAITEQGFEPALLLAYIVFVPVQELMYRGVLQGILSELLVGPDRDRLAILASNAVFLVGHLFISAALSVIAFGGGLVWGWLYARQRSLVGPSVSHILLGLWTFQIVGLPVG
jgi:CRP-like cAMP-binding protein